MEFLKYFQIETSVIWFNQFFSSKILFSKNKPIEQAILVNMGDDNIAQPDVLLEIGVMRNASSYTNDEYIVNFLESSQ